MTVTSNIYVGLAAWTNHTFVLGERCSNSGNAYQCITPGTSTAAPTGNSSNVDNGGAAHFKWLTAVSFTTLAAAVSSLPGSFTQPIIWQFWNCGTITTTSGTQFLNLTGHTTTATNNLTLTTAPGEGIRDTLQTQTSPFAFSATGGVSFTLPASGVGGINYFEIGDSYVVVDGLQFKDPNSTSGSTILDLGASVQFGSIIRNCIFDGFAQSGGATIAGLANVQGYEVYNNLFIDRSSTGQASGANVFAIYGEGSYGAFVNNTFISTTTNTVASAVQSYSVFVSGTNLLRNNAVFGWSTPYLAGTSGNLVNDHTASSASSIDASVTNNGNNQLSLTASAQFVSTTTDFRLKIGSGCLNAGATDLTNIPSADDIAGVHRPQSTIWDIGAWELVPAGTTVFYDASIPHEESGGSPVFPDPVIYILGNGTGGQASGVFIPASTATATVQVWGAGQSGDDNTGNGGKGGSWAQKNSYPFVAGTPILFKLGAPGIGSPTTVVNGGDTWFGSAGTLIAPGGGSATVAIGDGHNAGGAGGVFGGGLLSGTAGGGGAGGPAGIGSAGGNSGAGTTGGSGGGASNAGGVGVASTTNAGGHGGGSGGGVGGLTSGSPSGSGGSSPSGGGGGGGFGNGTVTGVGGNGGDDYDVGGGGAGGSGNGSSVNGANGGTPGGGGSDCTGSGTIGNGGWGGIRIAYVAAADAAQIYVVNSSTTNSLSIPIIQIPASWPSAAKVECHGGGGGGATGAAAASGAGGGGGAYALDNTMPITPGGTLSVQVGAGGAPGSNGGTTTVGGTTVQAVGGHFGSALVGGAGGLASASTGDLTFSGGNGGAGLGAAADAGGGGGGAAGPNGAGSAGAAGTATVTSGAGGNANGGLAAGGASAGAHNVAGNVGTADPGGGGGGSGSGGSSTAKAGGPGAFTGGGGGGGGGGATSNTGGSGGGGLIILTALATTSIIEDWPARMEWGGTVREDFSRPSEWQTVSRQDVSRPMEWSLTAAGPTAVQADYAARLEWIAPSRSDRASPMENQIIARWDVPQPIEWTGSSQREDVSVRQEWGGAVRLDVLSNLETLASEREDVTVPQESLLGTRNVLWDEPVRLEWSGSWRTDNAMLVEKAGVARLDGVIPTESSGSTREDVPVSVESVGTGQREDVVVQAEWSGSWRADYLALAERLHLVYWPDGGDPFSDDFSEDFGGGPAGFPMEWSGAAAGSASVPAEWLIRARYDIPEPLEWTGSALGVFGDNTSPIEWSGISRSDVPAPLEWGGGAAVAWNATASLEWLAVARADATIPSEWSGLFRADSPMPLETTASMRADALLTTEWLKSSPSLNQFPLELTAGIAGLASLPFEVQSAASIEWDASVPIMWSGVVRLDAAVSLEMTGLIREDIRTATETTGNWREDIRVPGEATISGRSDVPVPAESLQVSRADLSVPIEDVAVGAQRSDISVGVEFTGTFREDVSLPAEAVGSSRADTPVPAETIGSFYSDVYLPFVYLITARWDVPVGGESQQEAAKWDAISWIEYSSESNIQVVNYDVVAPLEWGGISFADTKVPDESAGNVRGDASAPLSYEQASQQDLPISLEATGDIRLDVVMAYQIKLGITADTALAAEWQQFLCADLITIMCMLGADPFQDWSIPMETLIAASGSAGAVYSVPFEWQSQITVILEDVSVPMEWTIKAAPTVPVPSEWLVASGPYTVISIEWHGSMPPPLFAPAIYTAEPPEQARHAWVRWRT